MDAKLTLSRRDVFGKKAKTLTEDGKTLVNIFGKGRESIAAFGDSREIEKVVSEAGKNHPIDLTVGDEEVLVLVSEVERDYRTRSIHHVGFQVVIRGQKVTTEVPIHQTGEAPAAKLGLIVVSMLDSVEIEAIPSKIPEALEISIEGLSEDGDSLHVSDIAAPEDVEIKTEGDRLIVKVETPRSQIEDEEDEGDEEEAADAADVPSEHGGDSDAEESGEAEKSE